MKLWCNKKLIALLFLCSMLTELACNAGAMRKETLLVKFAMRSVKLFSGSFHWYMFHFGYSFLVLIQNWLSTYVDIYIYIYISVIFLPMFLYLKGCSHDHLTSIMHYKQLELKWSRTHDHVLSHHVQLVCLSTWVCTRRVGTMCD